jgi:hypothetical protein
MCNTVDDYPWSSHTGYISSAKKWDWLYKEFLLGMFSQERQKARRQYKDFVRGEDSGEVTDFFSKKNLASFFGSQDFVDWVKATYHQLQSNKEIPQSRLLAPTITEIKEIVCQCYEVEEQNLEESKRGQTNEPRNVAVYLARKKCGLRLDEIGREFGIEKYSSVSSIVTKTEKQLSQNKELKNMVDRICQRLDKSQAKI